MTVVLTAKQIEDLADFAKRMVSRNTPSLLAQSLSLKLKTVALSRSITG